MDKLLIYKESSGKKSGRRLKLHRPSWNDNLTPYCGKTCVLLKGRF